MDPKGLITTDFPTLPFLGRGKVRDIYALNGSLVIVATDRISAFDVIMHDPIPGKGEILTRMSLYWFEKMRDIVENHVISADVEAFPESCHPYKEQLRNRSMWVKQASPLPVECIVRGYLSGSAWKDYRTGKAVSGIMLPQGLRESARLSEPVFSPSTKAAEGEHDLPMTKEEMINLIGSDLTERIIEISMKIYERASLIAESRGIIIADTKMEFGLVDGRLILIDELLTPDSSRFWPKDDFQEGRSQESFDKQFLRDYLLAIQWNQKPPAPRLPACIVDQTKERYEEALARIIG